MCTTIERIVTNTCNAIGDYYRCKAGATFERTPTNTCHAIGDYYRCKAGALIKCRRIDTCYAIGDCYGCKFCAACERTIADRCNSVPDSNISKIDAIAKCCGTNECNTIRYGYISNVGIIHECHLSDAGYRVTVNLGRNVDNISCSYIRGNCYFVIDNYIVIANFPLCSKCDILCYTITDEGPFFIAYVPSEEVIAFSCRICGLGYLFAAIYTLSCDNFASAICVKCDRKCGEKSCHLCFKFYNSKLCCCVCFFESLNKYVDGGNVRRVT